MKLKLKFDNIEPVDVNDMYIPTVSAPDSNGKRHGFLRSSYELMAFQDKFDAMLRDHESEIKSFIEQCRSEYEYLGFKVTLLVGMPREAYFYKRKTDDLRPHDASNYPKAIEDRLSVFTGIDDKYNVEMKAVKYCSDSNTWGFSLIMEPVNYMTYNEEYYKEAFNE